GSEKIVALANAAELDEYTYLVAGCVGEFWTRICFRRVPRFARLEFDTMKSLGRSFGQGLQLVNILRDLPADLRAGRCYLPADELAAAGCDVQKPCKRFSTAGFSARVNSSTTAFATSRPRAVCVCDTAASCRGIS